MKTMRPVIQIGPGIWYSETLTQCVLLDTWQRGGTSVHHSVAYQPMYVYSQGSYDVSWKEVKELILYLDKGVVNVSVW
jgi:hypothetical protein